MPLSPSPAPLSSLPLSLPPRALASLSTPLETEHQTPQRFLPLFCVLIIGGESQPLLPVDTTWHCHTFTKKNIPRAYHTYRGVTAQSNFQSTRKNGRNSISTAGSASFLSHLSILPKSLPPSLSPYLPTYLPQRRTPTPRNTSIGLRRIGGR